MSEGITEMKITTNNDQKTDCERDEIPSLIAAIDLEPLPELSNFEDELRVFLAPYAVDSRRIHYCLEEIFNIFEDYLPPKENLFAQLYEDRVLVDVGEDFGVPRLQYVVKHLLRYLYPEEAGDSGHCDQRMVYLTLKGVLWLLRTYGTEPYPHRHMKVPSELIHMFLSGD